MLETNLRAIFEKGLITPIARFTYCHVDPNAITFCALVTGVVAAIFLSLDMALAAVSFLLLSGYLDVLDGAVARLRNQSTQLGTLLDILSDRIVESAVVIAFFIREPTLALITLCMLATILLCVTSFLLVGLFSQQKGEKSFYYSSGLIERAEAFIFFTLMILLPDLALYLGSLFVLLVLWTTFYRVHTFSRQIKQQDTIDLIHRGNLAE